ncbi:MAG TPA: chemotaxis protein CheW [Phycisphaerae bacterium]|nr:chemotaxis protein CheW [Phycisphaerae bacterium]
MATSQERPHDIPVLLGQLSQTAKAVEKDDLGTLAKMHSWCEAMAEGAAQSKDKASSFLPERARSVAQLLEAIILGEAPDPDATIASVIAATAKLAALLGADSSIVSTAATDPAASKTSKPAAKPQPQSEACELAAQAPTTTPSGQQPVDESPAVVEPQPAAFEAPLPSADTPEASPAAPPVQTASAPEASNPEPASEEAPYEQVPQRIDAKEMEFVKGFLEEANEHIQAIEAALLEVERTPEDKTSIDNLFRPFHTIKGMAGFLNLRDITCLTHEAETLMDQARKGKRQVTPGLIDVVFDVVDVLKAQLKGIAAFLADSSGGEIFQPPVTEIIAKLRGVIAGRIEPGARQPAAGTATNKVGENLVEQGACAKEVVAIALEAQQKESASKKTGEILIDMGATTPKQVSQAIRPQTQKKTGASMPAGVVGAGDQSVRIDTSKLDSLVDMVGELVIAQTLVGASSKIATDIKLAKDVDQVGKIVRNVQELAMSMRMMPIGPTFQKMARVVRDTARKAGKQVELTITGEDTELDKNVIQQIGDPLIHMVRNAVDHGIELPEVRRAAGKPETGYVYLRASHQGGNIVIEVGDDGKGLDPKVLIAKGIEKGLVQPGEELNDQQVYALIFAPGFSTAAQVTDISGRGVGMDVVRRNIEQLRGRVDIASALGRGSAFTIRLPLTLAIIDGMVIKVGEERFIIPTIAIEQALRPTADKIATVQHRGEVLNVRGRLIPLIQLGSLFKLTGRVNPTEAMVVIAHCEGRQIGLVVDELIGQQQVVIKTLGHRFERLRGVAGAAILGDGRVGLILEISGLAAVHAVSHATTCVSETTEQLPEPEARQAVSEKNQGRDEDETKQPADRGEPVPVSA